MSNQCCTVSATPSRAGRDNAANSTRAHEHDRRQKGSLGELAIDYDRRRVTIGGRPVKLTATEYELLRTLSLDAGRVVTYQKLLRRVWGGRPAPETQRRAAGQPRAPHPSRRMYGKSSTSRIDAESVSSITRRSMPRPWPPVGGRPYSRART